MFLRFLKVESTLMHGNVSSREYCFDCGYYFFLYDWDRFEEEMDRH